MVDDKDKRMSEWMAIETAPKDGTEIDVWCPSPDGGRRIANTYWNSADGKWRKFGQGDYLTWTTQPTHWMPIPSLPMNHTVVDRIGALEAALKPFADAANDIDANDDYSSASIWEHRCALDLTIGDLRRARRALNP